MLERNELGINFEEAVKRISTAVDIMSGHFESLFKLLTPENLWTEGQRNIMDGFIGKDNSNTNEFLSAFQLNQLYKDAFNADPENNNVDLRQLGLPWSAVDTFTGLNDCYRISTRDGDGVEIRYRSHIYNDRLPKDGSKDGWYQYDVYNMGQDEETSSDVSDYYKNLKEALTNAENQIVEKFIEQVNELTKLIVKVIKAHQ